MTEKHSKSNIHLNYIVVWRSNGRAKDVEP